MVQKTPPPPWRQSPPPQRRKRAAYCALGYIRRAKTHSLFSWKSGGIGKLLYSKAGYSRQGLRKFWAERLASASRPAAYSQTSLRSAIRLRIAGSHRRLTTKNGADSSVFQKVPRQTKELFDQSIAPAAMRVAAAATSCSSAR